MINTKTVAVQVAEHAANMITDQAELIAELRAENARLTAITAMSLPSEQAPKPVYRKDDGRVVVFTNAYVSHRANPRAAKSQYSITLSEAEAMRDALTDILARAALTEGQDDE